MEKDLEMDLFNVQFSTRYQNGAFNASSAIFWPFLKTNDHFNGSSCRKITFQNIGNFLFPWNLQKNHHGG